MLLPLTNSDHHLPAVRGVYEHRHRIPHRRVSQARLLDFRLWLPFEIIFVKNSHFFVLVLRCFIQSHFVFDTVRFPCSVAVSSICHR
ncbi:hypothetical protein V6N13_122672 [Hibiscus sabdariffa]